MTSHLHPPPRPAAALFTVYLEHKTVGKSKLLKG